MSTIKKGLRNNKGIRDNPRKSLVAFAPATVGNVAVGFDILGFAIQGVGDHVRVEKISEPKVEIACIEGVVTELPFEPLQNTASRSLMKMRETLDLPYGFRISIKKGIPLASGMGGSAASAVGAVVAANGLLSKPLKVANLLEFALAGENLTSGQDSHADNIAPCLFGGLQLTSGARRLSSIPCPQSILCVLVHPDIQIETKAARSLLKSEISLRQHVLQSARLAGFLVGCINNDMDLILESMCDIIIEPQREKLIPGFQEVKSAAILAGALGVSISGSGPSVFAWVNGPSKAKKVKVAMEMAFAAKGLTSTSWISRISKRGAQISK